MTVSMASGRLSKNIFYRKGNFFKGAVVKVVGKEVSCMKKRMIVVIALVIMALSAAGTVFASSDCQREGANKDHKGRMEALVKELNLTADQQRQLEESRTAYRQQAGELRGKIKEKRGALKTALSKPGVTKEGVEPIVAEIKTLQAQMVDQRVDGILSVKKILTPEQFEKMQQKMDKKEKSGRMKHDREE